ncbi:MAG: tetratricopeptide repeat protein [Candidatus Omnitrophota bacterium]
MKRVVTIVFAGLVFIQAVPAFSEPFFYKDVERRMAAKEFDEAESLLGIYLSLNDKDVTALSMLGRLYQEMGNRKRAAQYLNKAIKVNPGYPPAHFFLGKSYYMDMKDKEAASELAVFREKMGLVTGMSGEDRAFYITMLDETSEIYYNLKMLDDFYEVNQSILKVSPDDQVAVYNMGVYYYVNDHNNSKAYQAFNKAVALSPGSELANKAKYAIEFMRANPDSRMAPDFDFIDKL